MSLQEARMASLRDKVEAVTPKTPLESSEGGKKSGRKVTSKKK